MNTALFLARVVLRAVGLVLVFRCMAALWPQLRDFIDVATGGTRVGPGYWRTMLAQPIYIYIRQNHSFNWPLIAWYAQLGVGLWFTFWNRPLATLLLRGLRDDPARCQACGYNRSGLTLKAPCPECGAPATG